MANVFFFLLHWGHFLACTTDTWAPCKVGKLVVSENTCPFRLAEFIRLDHFSRRRENVSTISKPRGTRCADSDIVTHSYKILQMLDVWYVPVSCNEIQIKWWGTAGSVLKRHFFSQWMCWTNLGPEYNFRAATLGIVAMGKFTQVLNSAVSGGCETTSDLSQKQNSSNYKLDTVSVTLF